LRLPFLTTTDDSATLQLCLYKPVVTDGDDHCSWFNYTHLS